MKKILMSLLLILMIFICACSEMNRKEKEKIEHRPEEEQYSFLPAKEIMYVCLSGTKVREGPGRDYLAVDVLSEGQQLQVTGMVMHENELWYQVKWDMKDSEGRTECYILGELLTIKVPEEVIEEKEGGISWQDTLICGKPILSTDFFRTLAIGDIIKNTELKSYKEYYSKISEKGYLHFWVGKNIIYISGEPSEKLDIEYVPVLGFLLKDDVYALNCGLRVGMHITSISDTGIGFRAFDKEEILNREDTNSYIKELPLEVCPEYDSVYVKHGWVAADDILPGDEELSGSSFYLSLFVKEDIITGIMVNDSFNQYKNFSIKNLLVAGHGLFEDKPYWMVTMDEIKKFEGEDIKEIQTEPFINGYFTCLEGDGSVYVFHGENNYPIYILFTNRKYIFGNGLQVGMTEDDIAKRHMDFQKYEKKQIGTELFSSPFSNILGKGINIDFDFVYYFDGGLVNYREAENYGGKYTGYIAFYALVKEGHIVAVGTDLPNAN